jgi:hypothetical protein
LRGKSYVKMCDCQWLESSLHNLCCQWKWRKARLETVGSFVAIFVTMLRLQQSNTVLYRCCYTLVGGSCYGCNCNTIQYSHKWGVIAK